MRHKLLILFALAFLNITTNAQANPEGSIVEQNGRLQVKGSKITNQYGEVISLAGMSLFWSQWAPGFYNDSCINFLAKNWKCNIIRAAMAVESDGYLTNPEKEKAKIETVVNACINAGIYVIIDWHDHNAQLHKTEAQAFFKEMAEKYGNYPNVIYEIFNEPLQVSWSTVIKPYAIDVMAAIRESDPDNLILVGNADWDQKPLDCANDPIKDVNVAYTFHFYVGQHATSMASNAISAMNKGVAIFVSEWGLWGQDTDFDTWAKFLKTYKLSHCNWSVNTKDEYSSALLPGASEKGGWTSAQLTPIGLKVRNLIQNWGPAIKQKPVLEYANIQYPSKYIQLHFSQPIQSVTGSDSTFKIFAAANVQVSNVSIAAADNKKVLIALDNALTGQEGVIKISFSGNYIIAENGLKSGSVKDFIIKADSIGSAPYPIEFKTDTFGKYISIKFNKTVQLSGTQSSGFEVLADNNSILDSISLSNTDYSVLKLFTKNYFNENAIDLKYVAGSIIATDGGKLESFTQNKIYNLSNQSAPIITSINLISAGTIKLAFDKPIKILSNSNIGFVVIKIDAENNTDTISIQSFDNQQYNLVLKLEKYVNNTDKVYISFKNGQITGLNTPYEIAGFDKLLLENNLPKTQTISNGTVTRIQAENYINMSGVQTETTTDAGEGLNVGYIEANDWMDYMINVEDTGVYSVTFRIAAESAAGSLTLKTTTPEQNDLLTLKLPITTGWQKWQSVSTNAHFAAKGIYSIRILAKAPGWNFNWMEFGAPLTTIQDSKSDDLFVYPTLIKNGYVKIKSSKIKTQTAIVNVYNSLGNNVFSTNIQSIDGTATVQIPSNLQSGFYFISMSENEKFHFHKVIVVR